MPREERRCRESVEHLRVLGLTGLIHRIVRRQWPGEADYADLIQEGPIGLWLAILRYEPERGHTFATATLTTKSQRLL